MKRGKYEKVSAKKGNRFSRIIMLLLAVILVAWGAMVMIFGNADVLRIALRSAVSYLQKEDSEKIQSSFDNHIQRTDEYMLSGGTLEIPKLCFEGNISLMLDKNDVRNISVSYENGDQKFDGYAELKIQGTSSLGYEKKNYTIKFYEDEGHENKLKVDFGWGAQNKYCLKANWIDKTHARNVVTAKLARQVQEKYGLLTQAPCNGLIDGFPVEIYDNGDFLGLYTFNIPKDAWQFGMDEENQNHIVICGEGWEPANMFWGEPDFITWEVEAGEKSEQTLEKMKALFEFVKESSAWKFKRKFRQYIDLDAAMNYYIISDVAYLKDNMGKNMLLATYDGKKWYPSLYDLDSSWGTYFTGMKEYDYVNEELNLWHNLLFARMELHFSKELAQRYFELREDILSKEHIMAEFESFRAQIPEDTFHKEADRWKDIPGYDYNQIQHYLDVILPRLDAKYTAMME